MIASAPVPTDVGRLLDRGPWSAYQKWLVLLTALTIIFDGFDNQLLGLALPSIMRDWGLERRAFAPVVSLGYLGMMLGGAVAGLAGDRFGRRSALLGSMFIFGGATLAISIADGIWSLTALRFVVGIGLGGAIPNGASLAAEYVPLKQRALAVTLAIVCVPLGGTVAGLFAVPALPSLGWRGMFAAGGLIPVLGTLMLSRLLPESPRFLATRPGRWPELARLLRRMGHSVEPDTRFSLTSEQVANSAALRALLARELRVDTLALWTAFLSCLLAVYLGFSWLPSLLTSAGLGAGVASTSLAVFNLGGVIGAVAGGSLITRFGSRPTLIAMAAGGATGALVLSRMNIGDPSSVMLVLVMLAVTGGLINAVQTTMYALATHVYPTVIRATGVGAASAVGRSGAILSGYAGPSALEAGGSSAFFGVMAGSLSVTLVSLAVVRRHVAPR